MTTQIGSNANPDIAPALVVIPGDQWAIWVDATTGAPTLGTTGGTPVPLTGESTSVSPDIAAWTDTDGTTYLVMAWTDGSNNVWVGTATVSGNTLTITESGSPAEPLYLNVGTSALSPSVVVVDNGVVLVAFRQLPADGGGLAWAGLQVPTSGAVLTPLGSATVIPDTPGVSAPSAAVAAPDGNGTVFIGWTYPDTVESPAGYTPLSIGLVDSASLSGSQPFSFTPQWWLGTAPTSADEDTPPALAVSGSNVAITIVADTSTGQATTYVCDWNDESTAVFRGAWTHHLPHGFQFDPDWGSDPMFWFWFFSGTLGTTDLASGTPPPVFDLDAGDDASPPSSPPQVPLVYAASVDSSGNVWVDETYGTSATSQGW